MDKKFIFLILAALALGGLVPLLIGSKNKGDTRIGNDTKPTDGSKNNDPNTISDTQARIIKDRIFDAMDRLGTDEDTVFRNLENLNGASLQKVYKAFGKVKYWAGEESGIVGNPTDLFGWFEGEFSGSDLNKLRAIFRKTNLNWI